MKLFRITYVSKGSNKIEVITANSLNEAYDVFCYEHIDNNFEKFIRIEKIAENFVRNSNEQKLGV